MDAAPFARKWIASERTERAASQEHFGDLCALVDEQTPNDADPTGDFYAFEKGAERTSAGDGFADVWLKDHFGWEYKGKGRDLRAAYKQLLDYHEALGQPPLLVVCDLERFEVHTKWTGFESWTYQFDLTHLTSDEAVRVTTSRGEPAPGAPSLTALEVLKALWEEPERLRPVRTTEQITREAAELFEGVVAELRGWGNTGDMGIARFVSRTVFCMFASDIGLLPRGAFSELLRAQAENAGQFREALADLFRTMERGGRYGAQTIPWINGDLFTDNDVPDDLTTDEILTLQELDALNWADVEPAIFGTLFERILDKKSQAKLGAHYTSRTDIETLVEPVLMAPLRREWETVREAATEAGYQAQLHGATEETQHERIREHVAPFLDRLTTVTVLDPACGSGNFLYVSLALLKGLEKEAIAWAGLQGVRFEPRVHPRQLLGIEINPYAHELAAMVVWIGYLQWKQRNIIPLDNEEPILQKLDQITLMDAIVDRSHPAGPREPEWPLADVIVGNPPFLGTRAGRMRKELGDKYVDALHDVWEGRVAHAADLCCYWHEKGRQMVQDGRAKRVGLLATQGIRGGASRVTLARIKESGAIFFAESDRKWTLDGAAVQVSMVGFDDGTETQRTLDGRPVEGINSNLTTGINFTLARPLRENRNVAFQGVGKVGPFDISEAEAERLLTTPNPDGRRNADVVRPWLNGDDLTGHRGNVWIIDFPLGMPREEAELYEAPFAHVATYVQPFRAHNKRQVYRERWWIHAEARPGMRKALRPFPRYLATVITSKHRLFAWLEAGELPGVTLVAFAREDDYFFGVLHSRPHELWALAQGTQLRERESGFRYTVTTCFQTFPLPWPPGDEPTDSPLVEGIAEAARRLNELREGWLNPEGPLVGEDELKRRTLTNLYNERPAWLDTAHRRLDEAVFNAYGWPPGLSDDEVLARLLALNQERAAAQG